MKDENMIDDILFQNKKSWDAMADSWFGSTALPTYGCLIPTEDELKLFPNMLNKKVLDIGCGSGHSLRWCGDNGATELWRIGMSTKSDCGLPILRYCIFDICYRLDGRPANNF